MADLRSLRVLGSTDNLNTIYGPVGDYYGRLRYYAYVGGSNGVAGGNGFPTVSNANGLLTLGTYDDGNSYGVYQMGFSANGNIYFRENGSTLTDFTNGYWNRLLFEDHNGDASVNGHLTLQRGKRVRLDAGGDAYMVRGTGTDYGLYISAGHEANGTTRANVYFEASAFMPGAATTNLGADWLTWNNIFAKRWYPDPANAPGSYIEWDATNSAFKIVGNVYSTGQVAAGGIISNS